jgi:P4 family phage/plasmid primase-like protien
MIDSVLKKFRNFAEKHTVYKQSNNLLTHTTLGEPKRSYIIKDKDHEEFMRLYIKIVKSEPNVDLHFVERPTPVTFLFLDFDFDQKQKKRYYKIKHIRGIIETVNDFVRENFDVTPFHLESFVLEKPQPSTKNDSFKDGFHIYYPNLPMTAGQRFFVLDHITNELKQNKLLDDIPYTNNMDQIIDKSIVESNGILMVGSKKVGGASYYLSHVFDDELVNIDMEQYDLEEQIYIFSNRRYGEEGEVNTLNSDIEKKIKKCYISHLSKDRKKEYEKMNQKSDSDNSDTDSDIDSDDNSDVDSDNNSDIDIESNYTNRSTPKKKLTVMQEKDIALAKKLVTILSKERATDFKDWRRVGYALYSVDESLYDSFIEFSKKNMKKYRDNKVPCKQIWDSAPQYAKFYSIGSIRHWAKIDDQTEYYRIISETMGELFLKAESSKHVDIANVVKELYKDRFVCVDMVKNKWYEFQENRWILIQSAYTLAELISDEVRKMMFGYLSTKMDQARKEDNIGGDSVYKRYAKAMQTVDKLADIPFRKNILEACASKFYDSNFQKNLDSNIYLIGFNNGVWDLKEHCFRNGLPTDYVCKTVGYDYKEFKSTDPVFARINKYFSQLHTESDMREYVLTFIASILRGEPDQKLHIWTGGGGNGKSATIDLLKNMLGEYFGILPVQVLTKKKGGADNASPSLADKNGKRLLVIQEPEHNDVIYVGQMKELSGADTIMARPLYGDPFEYVPQFTLILTCNNLPHIPSDDRGTWRRLRVTPYESEFVESNPEGSKQFLIDSTLKEEFPSWAQPLMWLILNKYYPIYEEGVNFKKFSIAEPAKVTKYTKAYRKDSDIYLEYLTESLEETGNNDDQETLALLYESFRNWYTDSYSEKPEPKKKFIKYLSTNKYNIDEHNIYGYRYKYSMA